MFSSAKAASVIEKYHQYQRSTTHLKKIWTIKTFIMSCVDNFRLAVMDFVITNIKGRHPQG